MCRPISFVLCAWVVLLANDAQAQVNSNSNGVMHVVDWPGIPLEEAADSVMAVNAGEGIIPSIDTLTIGYGYREANDQPFLTFVLEWKAGPRVWLDGDIVNLPDMTGDIYIESLVVRASVMHGDSTAGHVYIAHDSLMLDLYPGLVSYELTDLEWGDLFEGISDARARELFADGFALTSPTVEHVTFAYMDPSEGTIAESGPPVVVRPRRPRRRTVYGPSIDVILDFPIWYPRRPRMVDTREREREPRGDQAGRGARTRETERTRQPASNTSGREDRDTAREGREDAGNASGKRDRSGTKKSDDDEDDEDEDTLLPAAIAGVAAVAIVAVAGGTVGYYGNMAYAPIGLTAGYVRPEGGVLLQAAVNQAVFEKSSVEEEHLLGRVVGFYDVFNLPVQPAFGLGLTATQANNNYAFDASVSLGIALNTGPIILLSGYDVVAGGVDVSLAFNLRHRR